METDDAVSDMGRSVYVHAVHATGTILRRFVHTSLHLQVGWLEQSLSPAPLFVREYVFYGYYRFQKT